MSGKRLATVLTVLGWAAFVAAGVVRGCEDCKKKTPPEVVQDGEAAAADS